MEELLHGWDLEVLLPRLTACGITDTEALLLIGPEHSNRIFQPDELGLELKFFKRLKEYKSTFEQPLSPIVWAVGNSSESVSIAVDPEIVASSSFAASTSKRHPDDFEDEPSSKKSKGTSKIGCRAIENLDIHSVLVENKEKGPSVIQYFRKFNTFTGNHRNTLAAIVITAARSVKEDLKNTDFQTLSFKIEAAFPGESRFIYYIEPGTEGPSQTISKGKLPVRYRNVVKRERELAGVSSKAGRHPPTPNNNNNPYENITGVVVTQEIKDAYLWLEMNSIFDDWPLLKSKWRVSAPMRLRELFNDEGESIANYVTKWPVLKHPSGYSLLELDFECIYPDKELSLLSNWSVFVETIIHLGKDITDPVAKDCFALAQTVTHPGSKGVLALNILPALCPPTTKAKGLAKRRLLVSNSRAGLLLHVTDTASIAQQLRARREILYAENKKSQPFLVVVGPNLANIKEYYVDVSGILYRINSLAKAVDVCFKAITALHVSYPQESQKPWMMIQRVLYNITTDWDSDVPHALISSFNAMLQN